MRFLQSGLVILEKGQPNSKHVAAVKTAILDQDRNTTAREHDSPLHQGQGCRLLTPQSLVEKSDGSHDKAWLAVAMRVLRNVASVFHLWDGLLYKDSLVDFECENNEHNFLH